MAPASKKRRTETREEDGRVRTKETTDQLSSEEEMEAISKEDDAGGQTFEAKSKARKIPKHPSSEQEKAQAVSESYESKSNVFRMETEELLSEIRVDYRKRMAPAEKMLHKLKNIIEKIPPKTDVTIGGVEGEMGKRKIHIPFPEPRPGADIKYKFSYEKPTYMNIAGSYALKTVAKQHGGFAIDLVLQMPSTIFQEKDYLNYRYFHKRAYYLATIAGAIQESGLNLQLSYVDLHDDPLRPIIVVAPSGDGSEIDFTTSKCLIRIVPAAPKNTFSVSKLRPDRNAVRPVAEGDTADGSLPPTSQYNSSILADTTYFGHLTQLHEISFEAKAFKDACLLGRTWLKQRGFSSNINQGGFGHAEWSILMSLLLKGGGSKGNSVLAKGYSNYQMFKAMLQFLATRDLIMNPLLFGVESESVRWPKGPNVFDGKLGLNILFKMTEWGYRLLKHEAEITLKLLSDPVIGHFEEVFLHRLDDPCYKFDTLAYIPIPENLNKDSGLNPLLSFSQKLYDILSTGLTDRAKLIHLTLPSTSAQPIRPGGINRGLAPTGQIIAGFLLNAAQCSRAVDHGPPAGHKGGASYRAFWGDKAELRRFKDGSILESVVWVTKDSNQSIYNQIIQYLVIKNFGDKIGNYVKFIGDEYASMVGGGGNVGLFQPTMTAFEKLVKELRSLEGLPLAIRQVSAAASALRYSSVEAPLFSSGQLMQPADVVVQFESSGRWPDDLVAIQKTKIAFLLKMSELLQQAGAVTRIGLENVDYPTMNSAFMEVVYHEGSTFRVRIYHDREQTLLERQLLNKDLPGKKRDEITAALSEHRRKFIVGPLHTQEVQKLSHRFPALSPSIRLLKKWFQTHLLSRQVSEELVELMAIRTFVTTSSPPNSVMSGFLRTLHFISLWDWRAEPAIIGTVDKNASETFAAIRRSDPAMNRHVMVIPTEYDPTGTTFTESGPRKVVAARITALARSAVGASFKNIFISSTKDYDFVIHIEPKYNLPGIRSKGSKFKNLQKTEITSQDIAKLGLNVPGAFVNELNDIYGDTIIFFTAGNIIAGLWNPSSVSGRKWKVNIPYSTIPQVGVNDEEVLMLNKKSILNEISRLGGEILARIEINK
ncbi:Nrap protein [Choiromyces venosus 120613-1]|uniref:U3 small nucleolar RNA-associated protein 22 n=1 Tax=Choiromyces venosus 120613-1 TaxID=1336337 RepID=A0A3N4JDH5_9PEZI|nr:Nrap protein [Choiromyces venosus 120613-1]